MPTGEKTLRSLPPQVLQTVSGSSVNRCTTSERSAQSVQAYWYVGTYSSLCGLALAAVNCQMLATASGA
jgi:hypothetical protein